MKKFLEYLQEAPLPEDWDAAIYSERVPFAQRIRYAKAKAKQLGVGTSRVAFEIPYQGRKTVLKIAKNVKGMAQNGEEASALSEGLLQGLNIAIPLIDFDKSSDDNPTWVHTEFATKAKDSDFKRATGVPLYDFVVYCVKESGRERSISNKPEDIGIDPDCDLVQNFTQYISNYTHHPWRDYTRLSNWGIYHGSPVIIDIGLTDSVWEKYYKR